jgi:type I restriction enzyme S subunit
VTHSLPDDWELRQLDQIADVRLGRQRSPKNHVGTHMRPYLRAANVGWSGLRLDDINEMNFTDDEMDIYRLQPGDIVLSEASGSPDEVGKPAIWTGQIVDCAFQNTLLRVRSLGAEPKYLLYFFRHLALSKAFARRSRGVGIHHIGRAAIASWPVPLPPINEQRRIVEILEDHLSRLDAADQAIRDSQRRSDALREAHLRVLFDLGGLPTVSLGDVAEWGSGGTPRSRTPRFYVDGTIPWVVSGDLKDAQLGDVTGRITEAGLKESSARWVEPGCVLVAMYGATIGRLALTTARVTTNQAVAHAKPDAARLTAEYLYWFLRSQRGQLIRAGQGGAQPNISQTVLKRWSMPLPALYTQHLIAYEASCLFDETDRLKGAVSAATHRSVVLRDALMSAAFRGSLTTGRRDEEVERALV